jgi:hypothetical protein
MAICVVDMVDYAVGAHNYLSNFGFSELGNNSSDFREFGQSFRVANKESSKGNRALR